MMPRATPNVQFESSVRELTLLTELEPYFYLISSRLEHCCDLRICVTLTSNVYYKGLWLV